MPARCTRRRRLRPRLTAGRPRGSAALDRERRGGRVAATGDAGRVGRAVEWDGVDGRPGPSTDDPRGCRRRSCLAPGAALEGEVGDLHLALAPTADSESQLHRAKAAQVHAVEASQRDAHIREDQLTHRVAERRLERRGEPLGRGAPARRGGRRAPRRSVAWQAGFVGDGRGVARRERSHGAQSEIAEAVHVARARWDSSPAPSAPRHVAASCRVQERLTHSGSTGGSGGTTCPATISRTSSRFGMGPGQAITGGASRLSTEPRGPATSVCNEVGSQSSSERPFARIAPPSAFRRRRVASRLDDGAPPGHDRRRAHERIAGGSTARAGRRHPGTRLR